MKKIILFLSLGLVLSSCQIDSHRAENLPSARTTSPGQIDSKYSLSQDRTEFDKLRADIPADQAIRNDERALFAEWMSELRLDPAQIREKFDTLVRKKRETFNKDMSKIREDYSKVERKNKDTFLKDIAAERTAIQNQKTTREMKNDLFNELDTKRKDFFSSQRESRDEFESDFREKRKDFEDYIKSKSDEFNAEHKAYTQRYRDAQVPKK